MHEPRIRCEAVLNVGAGDSRAPCGGTDWNDGMYSEEWILVAREHYMITTFTADAPPENRRKYSELFALPLCMHQPNPLTFVLAVTCSYDPIQSCELKKPNAMVKMTTGTATGSGTERRKFYDRFDLHLSTSGKRINKRQYGETEHMDYKLASLFQIFCNKTIPRAPDEKIQNQQAGAHRSRRERVHVIMNKAN